MPSGAEVRSASCQRVRMKCIMAVRRRSRNATVCGSIALDDTGTTRYCSRCRKNLSCVGPILGLGQRLVYIISFRVNILTIGP